MRQLKVYGWQATRHKVGQTREIVAAHSMAEAARAAGYRHPSQMFNLDETGNPGEIACAQAEPGVVFYTPLDERPTIWRRATSALEPQAKPASRSIDSF